MTEYIERETCLEKVCEACNMQFGDDAPCEPSDCFMREKLMAIPTTEVVGHGEWTKSEDDWNSLTTITCSECHEEWCFETEEDVSLLNYRYCPNCGARMDGDNNA